MNDGITVEFEGGSVLLGNEITFLISEKEKFVYSYIPRNLEKKKKLLSIFLKILIDISPKDMTRN